jgi:hypothetical protein
MVKEQKKLNKLKEQNEFLKDMLEALDDVKHGRVVEHKFDRNIN